MKAIGIVGFKNSGKTTLALKIARQLNSRGYRVAAIKHVSEEIEQDNTDSGRYKNLLNQVAIIQPKGSVLFLKEIGKIEQIINYVDADIVIIEGFKKEKTFPKIVCLRDPSEKEKLLNGLEICTASLFNKNEKQNIADYSILSEADIDKMSQLVIKTAFKLPNLNCGACGLTDCFGLAKSILRGKHSIKDCVALNSDVIINVDGKKIPMNPFIAKMVKKTICGLLSPLKGFKAGNINIKLKNNI